MPNQPFPRGRKRKEPVSVSGATGSAAHQELRLRNRELTADNARLRENAATLQGSADDLGSLLASADIALFYVDRQRRLRGFTPAMRDLLEVSPAELGHPFHHLLTKFRDDTLLDDMESVMKSRQPREAEIVSDSGRAYVRRALPYQTTTSGANGVVVTFMDITRRKLAETALRTSEERHRLILESVAEYAILVLDPEGRFLTWPAQAERILGYTPEEAVGHPLDLIYPPEATKDGSVARELEEARDRQSVACERWLRRKNGAQFWATEVLSALHDEAGRMYGFVKVLRDNTERKRVEEKMRQAKIEAELANSAKDHFLANVSHELRTPLSATLLWAKLLTATGPATPTPTQIREGLDAILKSSEEQQALIEDLMDTSRIVAGKLRLEPKEFDLAGLVINAAENIRPAANEKGVSLEVAVDPKAGNVSADPQRLQQVIGNLLNNAIKFTPDGGRVRLTLERRGANVTIKVADTGQGIAPEFLPRIFDRFTQAEDSTIRTNGGIGLGLSIVRQLVELHGGTITVESDGLAKGATFSVRLPLPRVIAQRSTSSPRPAKTPSLKGLEILLVEDMPETRKALAAVLNSAGALVVPAASAQEALKLFNEKRPDLILSDIGLGKISGHEFIGQIRQWEKAQKTQNVPALALTAYADQKNREQALLRGFQEVLTKPVEPAQVIALLAALRENA
jgi:PAS domain S-box-containing protein